MPPLFAPSFGFFSMNDYEKSLVKGFGGKILGAFKKQRGNAND